MVTVLPGAMWNTRFTALPFTASWATPGPAIMTSLFTSNSPLVQVIVAAGGSEKLIVSPLFAMASAPRREPAPLSAVFMTVTMLARMFWALTKATQRSEIKKRRCVLLGKLRFFISVFDFLWIPSHTKEKKQKGFRKNRFEAKFS